MAPVRMEIFPRSASFDFEKPNWGRQTNAYACNGISWRCVRAYTAQAMLNAHGVGGCVWLA